MALVTGKISPDAAERGWLDAEIRCNQVLRYPVNQFRMLAGEFPITGFGVGADRFRQAVLHFNK